MRKLGVALDRKFAGACRFDLTEDITRAGRPAAGLPGLVESGDLDACYFSASYLAARVPELTVFDLPFQAGDRDSIFRKLDGELGRGLAEAVARATGFRVLGFWDNGVRHISNRLRPVYGPADCHGLRIRVLNSSLYRATFLALGCDPKVIDVKDLRIAVVSQEVDAQENPLTNIVNFKLHEIHRFLSMTAHFHGICLFLVNRERFDALPQDIRDGIAQCVAAATEAQRSFAVAEESGCVAILREAGVDIVPTERIDIPAFRDAVADVVAQAEAGIAAWALNQLRAD
jgi:C4-dicarboxylate-binding protein DctP